MICRARNCLSPCYIHGAFETCFCPDHFSKLTPRKRALVLSIASFSVLDITARGRANAIILECQRYLAARGERKHANG